jgi:asparagine synthase (glutamine-hydrolysing)
MCGIIGFSWPDLDLAKRMAEKISHRGPNDEGFLVTKEISLGHRRLSIIDLSKKGHQPMFNESNTICVVFNGEIYNFHLLKKRLEEKGHKFSSNSDTEVIIHGYEEYGLEICNNLDGMFAFALYDLKNKVLILARDRIGKKPLYYSYFNEKLIFASEIKAILECEEIKREINVQNLSDYLSLRFSPNNKTMFKGIFKLSPAHLLIYKNKKTIIKKFWSLPNIEFSETADEKKLDSLIKDSVMKRTISDVPIGVFLSGGLDSSVISSYLSKLSDKVKTFSIGFSGITDETKYAEEMSSYLNTEHKSIMLDGDILEYLPKVVWHFDEPLSDPAALPTYLLSKEVSKHVRVALSGEGGDEVFGGYQTFNYLDYLKKLSYMPKPIGRLLFSPALKFTSNFFIYPKKQMLSLASEIVENSKEIVENQIKLFYFPFEETEKYKLINKGLLKNVKIESPIRNFLKKDTSTIDIMKNNTLNYYFKEWLPNDLLMKADKMAMAHGLEIRCPFLDINLIDYFFKLDNSHKTNRSLFKKTIKRYIPNTIFKRKKQGFTLPISIWTESGDFQKRAAPHLNNLLKRNLFFEPELKKIILNPKKFKNDHKLYSLLNMELWNKIYLDGESESKIKL